MGRMQSLTSIAEVRAHPSSSIQELPGIGQETLHLADLFVQRGFEVTMPHLFGKIGSTSMLGNSVRVFCMRREFSLFSSGKTSPIVEWLAALCQETKNRINASGVGVIGMCLTGNFALSLLADDAVLAGVASQPSLPLQAQKALHMSRADIADLRQAIDQKGAAYAYRFEGDTICTAAKFKAIDKAFNDDKERVQLKTLPGKGHSVLTRHFVDEEGHPTREAFEEICGYFSAQLSA